ncbi:DUF4376 domain-containing protein [Plesiomonas shigelloides]|uniref:DUF4376 domain-containing protein n=1 Tax=Plesiomonas shigelloides TaxID=703 RepID=UPI001261A107|nr:DUF4376 domain-containing protein [Plesiomonas shigelloides]KAB7715698.1 DUF4376 domain-containing protein [Plesiomonas shigelloides]
MQVQDIKNAHYLESGAIDCDVMFEGGDEYIAYTALSTDTTLMGQVVWQELQSGKFTVDPFVVTQEMLDVAKEMKRREIEAWRKEEEAKPITFEWKGRTWNGGRASLERLAPAAMITEQGERSLLSWSDANNEQVPMTRDDLVGLYSEMAQAQLQHYDEIYVRQRELKEQLAEAKTLEDIRQLTVE